MPRFQIPLTDYNRIHQVAHGVLSDFAHVERACVFFACFGAMVLNKHYQIPARAVAGTFALCVTEKPEALVFGNDEGGRISSTENGFHMWVQTESHILDFMAPIYAEAFAVALPGTHIPRKMLQKRREDEAQSMDALSSVGDIFTNPNPELTETLIDNFLKRPISTDLIRIADKWFGRRNGRQLSTFGIISDRGEVQKVTLSTTPARGSW